MINDDDNNPAHDGDDRPEPEHGLLQNRNVLVIDDQSTGRTILTQIISQIADDITVISLEDPYAAIAWLKQNEAHLIVTDYRMPDMNGIDFVRAVRQMPECENLPVMMITVVSEKAVRYEALEAGVTAFLTRPIDQIECRTSCRNLLQMHEQHLIIEDRARWLAHQVEKATEQIAEREHETLIRLAKAGEYRDEGTGNHVVRMAKYSRQIAEALGDFDASECQDLEYAAPMHDIGKIGIPDSVLLKPGPLDAEEWEIMRQHPSMGHEILADSQSKYMQIGAVIAQHHHERFDGKGYPDGLKGDEIPLIARVVAVADVFDALVSERPYKAAWPVDDALDFIQAQSGSHFDPRCVQAFFERLENILTIKAAFAD